MANATLDDVIAQLKHNNRSEAGRDGYHTRILKAIAEAIVFMGLNLEDMKKTKPTKPDPKPKPDKNPLLDGVKGIAKELKLTDVANNITSPITGFMKSLPALIPGGNLAMRATKAAGKKVASAFEVEKKREDDLAKKKQFSILEKLYNATVKGFSGLLKGLGKAAGLGLGALLAPLFVVGGFFQQMITELGFIASKISQLARFIGRQILKIPGMDKVKNLATSFIGFITNYLSKFKGFFVAAPDAKELTFIQKSVLRIKNAITGFVNIFKSAGKFFNTVFKPIIQGFKSGLGIVTRFAGVFGRLLGRIFPFFAIIIGIFDSITGFLDGFKESEGESLVARVIDGIGGGIGKLFGNLVGIPLDLLKNVIAWILGKMGFENAAETLKEFKIADKINEMIRKLFGMISEGVDSVIDFFTNNKIGDKLSKGFSDSVDFMSDFLKSILRVILPKPNPDGNWWDAENLVSKAIPDAVYNYAGLDPKTGVELPQQPTNTDLVAEVENKSGSSERPTGNTTVINQVDNSNFTNNSRSMFSTEPIIDNDFNAIYSKNSM